MPLVDYASSSEDEPTTAVKAPEPPTKRRKVLPSVPSNYTVDPGDDPTLHQGRSRSRPFVPGELNAHIYVNLEISRSLRRELDQLVSEAQAALPEHTLHSLLSTPTPSQTPGELHVSLTHPLPLRRSQVETFRAELSAAISKSSKRDSGGRRCSLAGRLSVYYNGKATGGEGVGGRAFLALRLGAGSVHVGSIVDDAVHPLLTKFHLPLYHDNPEYHASFAWCLLGEARSEQPSTAASDAVDLESQTTEPAIQRPFSKALIDDLNERFEKRLLAAQPKGGWIVAHLTLRIGKTVTEIPLS